MTARMLLWDASVLFATRKGWLWLMAASIALVAVGVWGWTRG